MGWPPEDVDPLPKGKRKALSKARPAPYPRQTRLDEKAALRESLGPLSPDDAMETGEELLFARPGVSRQTLRKMRKGHWVVEAQIDLHGLDRPLAHAETEEFLKKAKKRGLRCVRIVHGKGLRSGHRGPVLKATVNAVLRRTGAVLAYVSARPVDGGTGAVYVLLAPD
jgi:DNA-nicking Smr family endonuclease